MLYKLFIWIASRAFFLCKDFNGPEGPDVLNYYIIYMQFTFDLFSLPIYQTSNIIINIVINNTNIRLL